MTGVRFDVAAVRPRQRLRRFVRPAHRRIGYLRWCFCAIPTS